MLSYRLTVLVLHFDVMLYCLYTSSTGVNVLFTEPRVVLDASSYSVSEDGQQTVCAVLENVPDPGGLDTAIDVRLTPVFSGLASKWTWYVRMHLAPLNMQC